MNRKVAEKSMKTGVKLIKKNSKQIKKGYNSFAQWLGGGTRNGVKAARQEMTAAEKAAQQQAKALRDKAQKSLNKYNKSLPQATGTNQLIAPKQAAAIRRRELALTKAQQKYVEAQKAFKSAYGKSGKAARDAFRQKGNRRLMYAGLVGAGLAGAGLAWPDDEEERDDATPIQEQEIYERDPMYYEREIDPYYNDGQDITQGSDGTVYIGGQTYDDRDKAAAIAAGFDNVFDYKAALYHLPNRDAVKALQRQLGLKEDGLFGINTERAYQEYLYAHPEEAVYRENDLIPAHRMGGWIHC